MIAATPLLILLPLAADPSPRPSCESLAKLALPATTIASAQSVAAGPMTMPPGPPVDVPAFCRVTGSIKPSADSDIQFEVWLPAAGWNGRFKGTGNGGFAGSISLRALAQAVARGYATAGTDTGHRGEGPTDASWAPGHPEKVVDFGYRAIHEMTVAGKALAAAFYGRPAHHSYFHGCSNGGRQALMEAQRFPDDYDGIIAGAPANDFTHLLAQAVWNRLATEGDPAAYIPASKVPAIEAATLAQCDAKDGIEDGVVDDPSACAFRPATLLCKGADSDACLSAAQVGAVEKLLAGPRATAVAVHPGLVAGGATGPGSWPLWITGPAPGKSLIGAFGTQFFRNMLFEDPNWDFRTFEIERDTRAADAKLARVLNATDPDLSAFRRRGGKLVIWHGWSDPAISPLNAIRYYESVQARMGARPTDEFVRLFMLPGVQHCDGGPGPTGFHGAGAAKGDAEHDVNLAIERWVEEGVAPARIVAAKFKTATEPASGVARTRPLCPYPQVARYKGTGSMDEAGSFACASGR